MHPSNTKATTESPLIVLKADIRGIEFTLNVEQTQKLLSSPTLK